MAAESTYLEAQIRYRPPVSLDLQAAALELADLIQDFHQDYVMYGSVPIEKDPEGAFRRALERYHHAKVTEGTTEKWYP